jgi:predicted ATP-binding protein involved in virulence
VSDIAYDLTIANTHTKDKYFLNGEGIVLIDEIEAHLHPNWQREIIPLLTKLFPNIQFFITTHSPQIIASVNSENIFTCENFTYEKIDIKTKGTDTNTLLQYVFNASERPRAYIERIKRFGEMIDAEKPSEEIEGIIKEVRALEAEDNGTDVSQLSSELELRLEAYKFDMEHEID